MDRLRNTVVDKQVNPSCFRSPSSVGESVTLPSELTGAPLLGNQGHLLLQTSRAGGSPAHSDNLTEPRPAPDHLGTNEEVFKLQFAATQYKTLVSKVEWDIFIYFPRV